MINKLIVFCKENISIALIIICIGIFSALIMNWILYNGVPILKTNISRDGWASFSGAFIGGSLTLIGVNLTIKNEAKRRRDAEKPIIILSKYNSKYYFFFSINSVNQGFELKNGCLKVENIGLSPIYKLVIKFEFDNEESIELKYENIFKVGEVVKLLDKKGLVSQPVKLSKIYIMGYDLKNAVYLTEIGCESEVTGEFLKVNEINYIKVAERIF